MEKNLTCFKAYDVRGELGKDFSEDICFKIGESFSTLINAKTIVVGHDARQSSPMLSNSLIKGINSTGVRVLDIGLSGTEEVYWATNYFKACGGIEVTASHNPANYNGLKFVKSRSEPLHPITELKELETLVKNNSSKKQKFQGKRENIFNAAKVAYIEKLMSYYSSETQFPLRVLFNSGNGAAGPVMKLLEKEIYKYDKQIEFIHYNEKPDGTFPNGVPNPLLPKNQSATSNKVLETKADIGVAFDGDFDRCFFFDETGKFIEGSYVVGLLAEYFLKKNRGSAIIYEPRVIWNTLNIIKSNGGKSIASKAGHAFIKQKMRETNAIYGGEISGHHYFRDFVYCDSGMIPWILLLGILKEKKEPLSHLISEMEDKFPCSSEVNFQLSDPEYSIKKVLDYYKPKAIKEDNLDGSSLFFNDWRFNIRKSNTEPLVRINLESKGNKELLNRKLKEISSILN